MSEKSSDEVTKFFFSIEQVASKRQTGTSRTVNHSFWSPPTNVYETEYALIIRVEIAGMRDSEFHISLLKDSLVISGIRPKPSADQPAQAFHQLEIAYGDFKTVVALPFPVNAQLAKARYRDGFLDIELPRVNP